MRTLPDLPNTTYNGCGDGSEPLYTAEQMRDYALASQPSPVPAVQTAQDFDAWQKNPYTIVLQKSIADDYVPRTASPPTQAIAEEAWQPIETAPKDGSEVLLAVKLRAGVPGRQLVGHYMPGGHCIEDHPPIDAGWYFWNGSSFDKASDPTHWKPLTAAPQGEKQ